MKIRLEEVSKYYQDQGKNAKGLENVSLSFETNGSFVAITGESGAGKSTLIRILTGMEDFDEGEIYFDDIPLAGISENEKSEIYARYISFVFQDYNLVESLKAVDNIVLALLKRGYKAIEAKAKAFEALRKVGLGKKEAMMRTSNLSGGERQRVAIVRSLVLDSPIIIFDEPTGNLDPETARAVVTLIDSIKENRLIIYVTHDYALVKDIATRHISMSDGHITRDETLRTNKTISQSLPEPTLKKMLPSSYLYASKAFAFSRMGRCVSTILILFFSTCLTFGVASGALFSFFEDANMITGFRKIYQSDAINRVPLGNRTDIRKSDLSMQNERYLVNYKEGKDYYRDRGGYFHSLKINLFPEKEIDHLLADTRNSLFSSLLTLDFNLSLYAPNHATSIMKPSSNRPLECFPVKIYFYDDGEFNKSSYGKAFGVNKLISLEDEHFLETGLSFDNSSAKECGKKNDEKTLESLLKSAPKIYIEEVLLSKDPSFIHSKPLIVGNQDLLKKMHDYLSLNVEKLSNTYCKQGRYFSFRHSRLIDGISFKALKLCNDNAVEKSCPVDFYMKDNPIFSFEENEILVPSSFPIDSSYFSLKGMKIPLSFFLNHQKNFKITPSKEVCDVFYIPSSYENGQFLFDFIIQKGGYDSFYCAKIDIAKDIAKKANDNGQMSAYYSPLVERKGYYPVIDFSRVKLDKKLNAFFNVLFFFSLSVLINRLGCSILAKFYFRKDYDQSVLRWIGYSKKDIAITNATQFLTIESILVFTIYPCLLLFNKELLTVFLAFPWTYIAGAIMGLSFAVMASLPKKRKEGKKE